MTPNNDKKQQDKQLEEMNYDPKDDLFNQEKHIRLDADGNPIYDEYEHKEYEMEMGLDVPGSDEDDDMEEIGSEDEENNYWSLSDNEDENFNQDEDLVD